MNAEITNIWQFLKWWLTEHATLITIVVSGILIWSYMVVPELERNHESGTIHRQVIAELHEQAKRQEDVVETLNRTAEILNVITQRLMDEKK